MAVMLSSTFLSLRPPLKLSFTQKKVNNLQFKICACSIKKPNDNDNLFREPDDDNLFRHPADDAFIKEFFEPDPVRVDAYNKEVYESEGFDVGYHGLVLLDMIVPVRNTGGKFNGLAESAIELYNKKMGAKFKFVEIEKTNRSAIYTYYITFTAVEDENDEPKVFQAIVRYPVGGGDPIVSLCRQKGNRLEGYMTDEYLMGRSFTR